MRVPRNVYGGPLDYGIAYGDVPAAHGWIDLTGRVFAEPGPGRFCYRYAFGAWVFEGFGAQRGSCGGCVLAPDPDTGAAVARCPLCGASQAAGG